MITNRTFFGRVGAGIHIPAVEADPSGFHIRNEELVLLHKLGEFTKTVTMSFFYGGNHMDGSSHLIKTFFFGFVTEHFVNGIIFLIFIMLGGQQQLFYIGININRVASVHHDCFTAEFFEMIVKDLRMFFFLICGKGKNCFNDMEAVFTCL